MRYLGCQLLESLLTEVRYFPLVASPRQWPLIMPHLYLRVSGDRNLIRPLTLLLPFDTPFCTWATCPPCVGTHDPSPDITGSTRSESKSRNGAGANSKGGAGDASAEESQTSGSGAAAKKRTRDETSSAPSSAAQAAAGALAAAQMLAAGAAKKS